MRIETHTFNGIPKEYKVSEDGTYYDTDTSDEIIKILENARINKTRLKIYLGDSKTGLDWMDEDSKLGKIGRSMGPVKIPILIKTVLSRGGGSILTGRIVKISTSPEGTILYQNPLYHQPKIEIIESAFGDYSHEIKINGESYSRHKSMKSAKRLFLNLS